MHSRKGLFFGSLFLTLLLMLPMMGTAVFFVAQRQQQETLRQAAAGTGGVAVEPGAQNTHRLLLAVQQEQPAFVLLRLDAPAQCITLCALPGRLLVDAPAGRTTLADCYMSAGPARAAQLLGDTVGLAPDAYLAATPGCWADIFDSIGSEVTARFDTAALLDEMERTALGIAGDSVVPLDTAGAAELLQKYGEDEKKPLRAAVWAAFWRQNMALLPQLPDGAKAYSNRTLTDLTAQEYGTIAQTLQWLSGRTELVIDYTQPDGKATAQGWQLSKDGMAELQKLLG